MSAVSTYAEALFGAAREKDELERVLGDLKEFLEALRKSEELELFFYGEQISEREKRRAIEALTEGMSPLTTNFLKVLCDNRREEMLEDVVRRYEEMVEDHLGRVEVEVVTATELSEEMRERIRERIARILQGREVILKTSVDPGIVGGAIFRFKDRLVDGSIRGRLEGLREAMLERGVV
ncbi:ATP synthase subunit delta [Rubrobacter xylanophilus DSM 9941]|uniref:ATP synthase F1 subunit delta n=1 Tax=Rubrobacter xylanophilus TaxID=49319 RepID=UPI001C63FE1C|nr:ATP synthase F1 subunit delta [Rubrobacter xylanophilus]QYJ14911.1 ATP synthase subunit delta [Rubrobacter xylanophilus DSM 9941]